MPQFSGITLAILAGGKSTRMGGRSKALLEADGQTFISRIHQSLNPLFESAIIISNDGSDYNISNVNIFPDVFKDVGPLGGIHSALAYSINPAVFIVSCDMPFVEPSIAISLVNAFLEKKPAILVPIINSYKEPLFAIYSKSLIPKIESIITTNERRSIAELFNSTNTLFLDIPDSPIVKKCFTNINSFEDYNELMSQ